MEEFEQLGIIPVDYGVLYSLCFDYRSPRNKIANLEKALCDMIIMTPKLRIQSKKALIAYLKEDLRFDMSYIINMDTNIIKSCIEAGKKKGVLELLLKLLQS